MRVEAKNRNFFSAKNYWRLFKPGFSINFHYLAFNRRTCFTDGTENQLKNVQIERTNKDVLVYESSADCMDARFLLKKNIFCQK
jgi:hypothetical protein